MSTSRGMHARGGGSVVALVLLVVACAVPQSSPRRAEAEQTSRPAAPSRIVAAVNAEVSHLYQKLIPFGPQPELEELVNAGLTNIDPKDGISRPQLAEATPSLQNGLWKLNHEGSMETSWTIREGAQWHDGTPFTTDDLLFTLTVVRDRELAVFSDRNLDLIHEVIAKDSRTISVHWRRPLYDADTLFSRTRALPIPKHLLERVYQEDKASLLNEPYWTGEAFVGSGPYQVRQWVRGSYAMLGAFDAYVLGRPKIDEIEVRFIQDAGALMANVLAGTVEMSIGRSLSIDQALPVQGQWREGTVQSYPGSWVGLHPQLLNQTPAIVGNVQFREALLRGLNRQQMAEQFVHGMAPVADVWMSVLDEPYWSAVLPKIPRYDYDTRRATQIIEDLGHSKRSDGFFYDAAGQKLAVEVRTTDDRDINLKTLYALSDDWNRLGVSTDPVVIPIQRKFDLEYRATFPGFMVLRGASGVSGLANMLSSRASLPENNYQASTNYSRYMNPTYDALYDRFTTTIPQDERIRVFEQVMLLIAQDQLKLGLLYDPYVVLMGNRIQNAAAVRSTWNAPEWEVKGSR